MFALRGTRPRSCGMFALRGTRPQFKEQSRAVGPDGRDLQGRLLEGKASSGMTGFKFQLRHDLGQVISCL